MLFAKAAIAEIIPDIPDWVETEMAKIEYRRRQMEKMPAAELLMRAPSRIGEVLSSSPTG